MNITENSIDFLMEKICKIKIIKLKNYSNIILLQNKNESTKFQIENKINPENLKNEMINLYLDWGKNGKSDVIEGSILYKEFLEKKEENLEKYIFHDFAKEIDILKKHIPLPVLPDKPVKIRVSRFYSGYKYSCSLIHNHSLAVNYLVSGKKIWIVFPNTDANIDFIKGNAHYKENKGIMIDHFIENYDMFNEDIHDIKIFIQEEGDAVLIPPFYFHGVVNVDDSFGLTYSWKRLKIDD